MHRVSYFLCSIVLTLGVFLLAVPFTAQAALYAPGATLDPSCAPTDTNCGIATSTTSVATGTAGQVAYYASNGNALSGIATSSLGLLTTDVAEGTNLYWTNARFDARLSATTSLPNITTLAGLSSISTSLTGIIRATAGALSATLVNLASDVTGILPVGNGGTGVSTIASGYIPFGNGASALATSSSLYWDPTNNILNLSNLAVNGNATTTGNAYFAGNVGVGTTPAYALDVNGQIAGAIIDRGGQVYHVKAYGAKCDGVTNDTAAFNNAITAAYNNNGGTIFVPNGKCLIAGQISFPNNNIAVNGPEPYSRQPNIRITGVGDERNGQSQIPGSVYGGSVLEMTFASSTSYKMQTLGLGLLEIDHLTFWDPSGDDTPFFLTTGTTVNIHDNAFIGSKSGQAANQDVLTMGGSIAYTYLNDPNAAFQGYDSSITNNYFNYIRRAVYAKTYVASLYIANNFIGPGCGSNLTGGAAMEFDGTAVGNNTIDNHIVDNRCEITGYYYCVKFLSSQNNYIAGNDVEDAQHPYNTSVYYFDASSTGNMVLINSAPNTGGITHLTHVTDLTISTTSPFGQNFVFDSTQSAPSTMSSGTLNLNGLTTIGNINFYPYPSNTATANNNYPSTYETFNGYYWTGAASATDTWTWSPTLGNGANPTSYLTLTHAGTSGAIAARFPTITQFGSSQQSVVDASGNFNIGNAAVYISNAGLFTSLIEARNNANTLVLAGRQTPSSGAPSVDIYAVSGLSATDVAVRLGAQDGPRTVILQNGNVSVGTTTPSARLTVWGPDSAASTTAFLVANAASTTEFTVLDNGNATLAGTLVQNSDQRLKTDVVNLNASSSLAAIDALNPVTFHWIDPAKGDVAQLGFIAQQVSPIFPDLISTTSPTVLTPGGTLSLNYIGLIAPAISAIQGLEHEITALASTVAGFAQSITTTAVHTQDLCVGSTCVTEEQFKAMLQASGEQASVLTGSSTTSQGADASTSTPAADATSANATNTTPSVSDNATAASQTQLTASTTSTSAAGTAVTDQNSPVATSTSQDVPVPSTSTTTTAQ